MLSSVGAIRPVELVFATARSNLDPNTEKSCTREGSDF